MFTPMAASVGIAPGIEASARMEGAVANHSFLFEAQGRMRNEAAGGSAYQGSAYQAITQPADDPWSGTTMFRLTPFTRVVWSGDYAMRAQTTLGRFADSNEIATAALTVQAADPWSGEAFDGFFKNLELVQTEPGLLTDGGSLSVSFANETAAPALGNLYVRVAAFGSVQEALGPNAPPVPEAGTWAMWLCGLGVIGAAARSRRRAAAGG
ncbi:PEP-CTERM sorting domain-containing protein [Azohydromonas sp. G-1-1-14]|uniref:PEP-CTERM sorting domain-containing protein n=2 Tax=Azohydromonas caseinilytica TaxID=2728836 RepID=A0A848F7H2_9BURK|nr:PEP-CTERM sorting domain-containing protein [Azohydromonas caseinilytica]